jgi:hypothetical protein
MRVGSQLRVVCDLYGVRAVRRRVQRHARLS